MHTFLQSIGDSIMQAQQFIKLYATEIQAIDFDHSNYYIRLTCGSEIIIDKEIFKRLQACEQAEKEFNERQSKIQ